VDGRLAARGTPEAALLQALLDDPYYALAPPKSTGREHFRLGDLPDLTPEDLLATLMERLALGPDYGPGEHVICDQAGRPYHPDTLSDFWRALCGEATVPKIRLHDARHTCGTLMHMQGLPIVVISQWLGHADPAFTMRTYVHSQDDALRLAAETLQRVVTPS
jgi:integrase